MLGKGDQNFWLFTDVINARPINQLTFCVIFLLKRSKLGRKKISYLHSFESNWSLQSIKNIKFKFTSINSKTKGSWKKINACRKHPKCPEKRAFSIAWTIANYKYVFYPPSSTPSPLQSRTWEYMLLPTNSLSLFDHFVGWRLKG